MTDVVSWLALLAGLAGAVAMATAFVPSVHGGWWATGAAFIVLVVLLLRPFFLRR